MSYNIVVNRQLKSIASGGSADLVPIGSVFSYIGTKAPKGYLLCDGATYKRNQYPELWEILKDIPECKGDGSTTFTTPNWKGKFIRGLKDGSSIGAVGGEETHTLTVEEMPSHNHNVEYVNGYSQTAGQTDWGYAWGYSQDKSIKSSAKVTTTGDSKAHNNLPPYADLNYIIKAVDIVSLDTYSYIDDEKTDKLHTWSSAETESRIIDNKSFKGSILTNANDCIPTEANSKSFYSVFGTNTPETSVSWYIEAYKYNDPNTSNIYVMQTAQRISSSVSTLYSRDGKSSDGGTTWTWTNWEKLVTESELKTNLSMSKSGTVYSGGSYSSGYFLLCTLMSNSTGVSRNHDIGLSMKIYSDYVGSVGVDEIYAYVRGTGTTMSILKYFARHIFGDDWRNKIIVTAERSNGDQSIYILKVYMQITSTWQRFNFDINYVTIGDVSTRVAPNDAGNLKLNQSYVSSTSGTVISRTDM